MAIVPVAAVYGSLVELEDIGSDLELLARLVESQKELFHSQIDQLQKIVVTQCKLTGANPLAQEMVRVFLAWEFRGFGRSLILVGIGKLGSLCVI